ncbi:SURF1 family cytochrome oxidase biogenesis protein [Nocardia caishijiensis]|uniref:SURF1-like protein n=1 Tax=Nocardia caishijiensis TaxID=184756 RepID=A0ABQ6YIP2_9NOCA|nr:SURF1 family cytochrome oxidase biogenesis protein [Nocardia caishijiensis]KAF0845668.1 cytochrome oxidase assembly protein ShyY1 [Nocardia caishijiensis]
MRKLTFLLRPSWLILALVVVAFAYLCFTILAPWQLNKNTSTEHRNQLIADSVQADPVAVTDILAGDPTTHTEWRKVTATGTFLPDSTVLVRLRHLDGAPGYAVLAAFRLDDGRTLLVDRGLVAAVDGTRPPEIAEAPVGAQRIEARVRASEGVVPDKAPSTQDGFRQVYTIDTAQESTVLGTPLTPIPTGTDKGGYLQLAENQPGAFTPVPLPQLDAGPYLSYGLQWLAFGVMAPLGLGYFVFAEMRARRRERGEAVPDVTDQPAETSEASTTEARLADRYGRTR